MDTENDALKSALEPETPEQEQPPTKKIDPTIYLLVLLSILIVSLAYFFVFALPKMQRERLAWEKEQFTRQQQLREAYDKCVNAAEAAYENYIKNNGTPVANETGAYSAAEFVWDTADKRREAALNECSRQFR